MNKSKKISLIILGISIAVLGGLYSMAKIGNNNYHEKIQATKEKSSDFEIKIKDKSNDTNVILDNENIDEGFLIDATE